MMVRLRLYYSMLILILFVTTLNAQEQPEDAGLNDLKTAYINFEQGNYSDAYQYFNQMLKIYPKDPTYNYYTGICLLHLENNSVKALEALRYASIGDVPDDVYFYLGLAYHRNYQFEDAVKNFIWFKKKATKKQVDEYALENYISRAQNGLYLIKYGKNLSIYSRENIAKDNFYKQYRFNDLDGKFMDRDNFFGWDKDSLAESTVLFVPNTLERNEVLYFAAKHPTLKDYDIYRITKLSDTTWSAPVNLGDVINTPFDENYPFIHSDGSTLYFASKGHYSMGGYDIYKSSWDWDRQVWSEPENLGFPINSPFDDILYVPSANNKLAMMSSNRMSGENEYTVYKFDPEYYSPYVELNNHEGIKQLAQLKVNATLDSREDNKLKKKQNKTTESRIKPSIEKDFLYKEEYDSLMNLALDYQLKADSLRWIIDDKREQFDKTPDGQSRAKLSNRIIELEQQVYLTQKSADKCYQRVREIEQQNMASKNIIYGFLGEEKGEIKTDENNQNFSIKEEQNLGVVYSKDSLHKIQFNPDTMDEQRVQSYEFGIEVKTPSRYTSTNPIPVNDKLPDGVVYMIQLGAFSSAKNPAIFKGLEPLTIIQKNSSKIKKYYAGKFREIKKAEQNLPTVKSKGFSDAFIVAFKDGKLIPINQAVKQEAPLNRTKTVNRNAPSEEEDFKDLSIIYTLNFSLMPEDTVLFNKIKELIPETKDIYIENQKESQKIIIKSFDNFNEAFSLKDKIELIVNKKVEVFAFFAEHQIPLEQAIKITQ